MLIQTAQRVVQSLREADTVARVGGDEFVVLLSDLDASSDTAAAQAAATAEKIRVRLAQPYDLVLPAHPDDVLHWTESSASVGWALFNGNDASFETVLHRADQSMYQLKRAGRGESRQGDLLG